MLNRRPYISVISEENLEEADEEVQYETEAEAAQESNVDGRSRRHARGHRAPCRDRRQTYSHQA